MVTPAPAPAPTSLRRLRQGTLLNLAGAAVTTVCTFGVALATTHALHPTGAGVVFALTSAFLIVAMILRLGTPTALVLFLARSADEDGARSRAFARLSLRIVGPLALGGAVLAVGSAVLIGRLRPDTVIGRSTTLAICLGLLIPFSVLLDGTLAVSRGHHRMKPTVAVERIGRPLAQLVLSVAALLWWPTILGLGLAWGLPYVPALVAAVWATPQLRRRGPVARVDVAERREFHSFLWARTSVSVAQILYARLDIVLLALLAGTRAAAIYGAATRFVVVAQLTQQSIGTAFEPGLARAAGPARSLADSPDALATMGRLYKTGTTWLVWLTWPMLLLCAVLAPWWLAVFGRDYVAGTGVVYVLVGSTLVSSGIGTIEVLLNLSGRARSLVAYNIVGVALMAGIDLALIPHLGALGAAIGWATTMCFKNIAPLIEFWVRFRLHPFSARWVEAAVVTSVAGGVIPLAGRVLGGGVGALVGSVLGAVLWAGAVWRRRASAPPARDARTSMDSR